VSPISTNPDKSYIIQIIRENPRICVICVSFYLLAVTGLTA